MLYLFIIGSFVTFGLSQAFENDFGLSLLLSSPLLVAIVVGLTAANSFSSSLAGTEAGLLGVIYFWMVAMPIFIGCAIKSSMVIEKTNDAIAAGLNFLIGIASIVTLPFWFIAVVIAPFTVSSGWTQTNEAGQDIHVAYPGLAPLLFISSLVIAPSVLWAIWEYFISERISS